MHCKIEEDRENSEWPGEETGQRKCLQVSKFWIILSCSKFKTLYILKLNYTTTTAQGQSLRRKSIKSKVTLSPVDGADSTKSNMIVNIAQIDNSATYDGGKQKI